MNITPIALAFIYHMVTCDDGQEVEVMTWTVGQTQAECLEKWQDSHREIKPSRVIEVVVPRTFEER